tara:strand:- start:1495 stop:2640 length:1146 start_codon:yes stop_codon:yes gene_type:complete
MSSLLEQALIDAKALKEAALKNAESSIIEKYSAEVRETLDHILEQDELDLGLDDEDPDALEAPPDALDAPPDDLADPDAPMGDIAENIPLGAAEGEKLCPCPDEGEQATVNINFGELAEALSTLQEELQEDDSQTELEENEEIDITEEDLLELLGSEEDTPVTEENTEADVTEEQETLESLAHDIAEELYVDMGADLSGWAGRSSEEINYEIEKELASRRSTGLKQDTLQGRGMADRDTNPQKELEDLKKAQEELVFENNQLKEQNKNYDNVVVQLKETASSVNTSNARLLYTNRVLRNTSLNERQKDKIVEAISGAGSVTEAKMIYETLQSTVESTPSRAPQSLNEAIGRNRTSVIRASREKSTTSDPWSDRMKKLAGIN